MSRAFSETQAAVERVCPFRAGLPGPGCVGNECMCWVWVDAPRLERTSLAKFHPDEHGLVVEQSLTDEPPAEDFSPPPEDSGWERKGHPCFNTVTRVWNQEFVRPFDPDRRGRCGLVSNGGQA